MELSRRQFIKLSSGTIASAWTYFVFREQEKLPVKPEKAFVSLSHDFSSATEVTHSFVRANTPFLMASYAVFYPDLLLTRGRNAIQELKKAKEEEKSTYDKNHHRLDALPAVAAAHLLPVTVIENQKDILCDEIANALNDRRREVREIVMQNLITATSPNDDTLRHFSVNDEVLRCIESILLEAEENEKLLTPATLCAEFLLNARVLQQANNSSKKDIERYDRLIDMLRMSRADHYWFVSKLVQLHEATFTSPEKHARLLLPQSSEALMGWKKFGYARDYLAHLSLLRARLMYTNLYTSSGMLPSDEVMNKDQASHALPKTISFFKNFMLRDLIDIDECLDNMPQSEKLFKKFMSSGKFDDLIMNPESHNISMKDVQSDRDEVELAKCVPFAQYREYGLLQKMADDQNEDRRKFIIKAVDTGFKTAAAGYGSYKGSGLLYDVVARIFSLKQEEHSEVPKDVKEKAVEQAAKKEEEIDQGKYEGVNDQERELDNIDLLINDKEDKQ
jgi:hypothetical protein